MIRVFRGCLHTVNLALLGFLATQATESTAATPPANRDELNNAVDAIIGQPRYATARWGVHVVSLDTGRELINRDAHRLFVPASNTKIFSGALAWHDLGPDFRIRTSLLAATSPDGSGTLHGDLVVYGRGDPSFTARFHDGQVDQALEPLVQALREAGVRRVTGDLVADESYFRSPHYGAGWEWDDFQYGYGAEVSALSVHENLVNVHVRPGDIPGQPVLAFLEPSAAGMSLETHAVTAPKGTPSSLRVVRSAAANRIVLTGQYPVGGRAFSDTVAVHNAPAWFGSLLKQQLAQAGIPVAGRVRVENAWTRAQSNATDPAALNEIAFVESPPLREVAEVMLAYSQNQAAHLLYLQAGVAQLAGERQQDTQDPEVEQDRQARERGNYLASRLAVFTPDVPDTTDDAAARAMKRFLATVGIPSREVLIEEGSGLTRRNMVTPAAITTLLRFMAAGAETRNPKSEIRNDGDRLSSFREALPFPGGPGTLTRRFPALVGGERLRAKTGYLRHTYALSGYLTTAAGEHLVFSVLANAAEYRDGQPSPREDLDALVNLLAAVPWQTE
ncbi:MAG: D-alanyl-D-alanine carboxypeptidase/D-alanyl-D-alanine-endopeptidase [Verrucomicrobiales bacterium]|nr:D-alanyl-D-alanine carboxypeptidase/D-alanyl-D-alanine-endopeptidase [Verrucomicrobiales bacterium]